MVGFSLNTDILETNLINIVILVFGLVKFVGASLNEAMAERKQKIIDSVTDSEKRLADARERLDEATTQFILSKSTTDKITQELQLTKTKIIKSGAERITNEVVTQMKAAELTIFLQEQKLLAEIKKQIITLALKRVILKLQRDLSPTQYGIIIEKSIDRIGEFKTLTSSGGTR